MLSKQLTSKLKEEQERENQLNPSYSNNLQCDRLIRHVSCKHDANHAIRKANINVLQSFDDIKLYVSPNSNKPVKNNQSLTNEDVNLNGTDASGQQLVVSNAIPKPTSSKLPRRNQSFKMNSNQNDEIVETDLKSVLNKIVEFVTTNNVSLWFTPKNDDLEVDEQNENDNNSNNKLDLFEAIQNALNHIDYNLKRNSDFINELTKLLDTSRAIKQEAQLKKILKSLEDEKISNNNNLSTNSVSSLPPSPQLKNNESTKEDDKKKQKTKSSFKGLSFNRSKSKDAPSHTNVPVVQVNDAKQNSNLLNIPQAQQSAISRQISAASSLSNLESSVQKQLKLNSNQSHEINNSDYTEIELEVEKISYYLDNLTRQWSKITSQHQHLSSSSATNDFLKYSIEFQTLISNLNSSFILKELEQSLFKLNWLITSKSGFSEPNWKTTVLSITPSTCDSFIGVNLLKNYYKYVKYDFVSYKLFTRQLQLIQICAIILNLIHRILVHYKETNTLASITNTLNGLNTNSTGHNNLFNDALNPSLLSLSFSADKYRPISWSANHVTLYNVHSSRHEDKNSVGTNLSRSSSTRRGVNNERNYVTKEEQIRQIRNELFLKDINEFLNISTERLNIQADLANRTGYFYIVNQSTGLVLQAVDFTSQVSLKEQIEENQRKLQNSSIKGRANLTANKPPSTISKGPRFYLMPKANKTATPNPTSLPASLQNETANDEQLWYYYLINGCIANKIIRSGHCMAASSLNAKSPVTFWPNVKTTNCSWFYNYQDQTIVSGLSDDLVLDYIISEEPPNQRYSVVIDTKVPNKASQKWSFEFC